MRHLGESLQHYVFEETILNRVLKIAFIIQLEILH
jgi:hypothetical protein